MIDPMKFYDYLVSRRFNFYTGVPDSLLKELCSCIYAQCPPDRRVMAANEGNAIALAAGYHLASGDYGVVYMQNSGLGNAVNPLLSLTDEAIYGLPMLLLVGWRGEPGVPDEPQHKKQGEVTLKLLEGIGLDYLILDEDYEDQIDHCRDFISSHEKPIALVVRKQMFLPFSGDECDSGEVQHTKTQPLISRERALEIITGHLSSDDFIVSTTGKTSRELYEIRSRRGQCHDHDFLSVGSMGHTASLALGISLATEKTVYCLDGDGSFLMHMGSLAVCGIHAKDNFKYILLNNGAHDSVGGQDTIAFDIDIKKILSGCGFQTVLEAASEQSLQAVLASPDMKDGTAGKTALIVTVSKGSRNDLGRPPADSLKTEKSQFIKILRGDTDESIDS